MLKKLLKSCLMVAMVGAFAASVSAEPSFTWTGNAEGTFASTSSSEKVGDEDAVTTSAMDIASSGDLDLSVKIPGDSWSGEAKIEFDVNAAGVSAVDDLYVVMSNESMAIWFGEFDPVGFCMGQAYTGEIDETKCGWGAGSINENGYVEVKLLDVGASVVLGMNEKTGDDGYLYNGTTVGGTYGGSFGDIDLKVQYFQLSTGYNEKDATGDAIEGAYKGASEADLLLGVAYSMGQMTFALNYQSIASSTGAMPEYDDEKIKETNSYTELVFDMGLNETSGISIVYDMWAEETKCGDYKETNDVTIIQASFMLSTGPVDHFVAYSAVTGSFKENAGEDNEEETKSTYSIMGYTMQVGF
jgi:hypothetical protein